MHCLPTLTVLLTICNKKSRRYCISDGAVFFFYLFFCKILFLLLLLSAFYDIILYYKFVSLLRGVLYVVSCSDP